MKSSMLYALWGGMFILCAGLGFIPEPQGAPAIFMTLCGLGCFLPPALLLHRFSRTGNRAGLMLIRNLSALSLVLTVVLVIANFLSAGASGTLGTILHCMLIIVSSPMFCCRRWALSLFLWACLLMGSLRLLRRK